MGIVGVKMNLKVVILWIVSMAAFPVSAKILYVDDDATGTGDGTSWVNAYVSLQDALTDADESLSPVNIHVGQGIYKPDQGLHQVPGDAGATFLLLMVSHSGAHTPDWDRLIQTPGTYTNSPQSFTEI